MLSAPSPNVQHGPRYASKEESAQLSPLSPSGSHPDQQCQARHPAASPDKIPQVRWTAVHFTSTPTVASYLVPRKSNNHLL